MSADAGAPPGVALDADLYRAFVAGLELERVETTHVRAERSEPGDMHHVESQIEASFAVDREQRAVFYKYDLAVRISGEDGPLGEVEASLVLVFSGAAVDVPVEMVDHFGGTSAHMIAFPYLRETAASLAHRIGFPGLILPIIRR